MRGPLGSLIAQLSNNCFQKALPPSLFAKLWRTYFIASHVPVGKVGDKDLCRCNLMEVNVLGTPQGFAHPPENPDLLSDQIAPYLFGYWNGLRSNINLGPKCDKKGTR
jgi:hypothetical protein